ncbi:hypothetical protein G7Z17_g1027 [Cylindrodendrum hubeiense]|uniref:PNPLA domain-containing protein n=1 Tax=Cylindrodendrum hubeiense TaxID=595255 RepID=A0A9P5HKA9_9HYPO|nr:hypothetical protein G7Z17_g1027 [Cylindrodendrum hubeiense]
MPSDSHDSLSSVTEATRRLLESFQESTRFEELQKKWKARGRVISTAEELILCYYESFRVISIPQYNPSSPAAVKQVSEQIKVLYNEILSMSKRIRQRKRSLNMDLDVSSLSAYLRRSVAALGNDFHNSLDFHQLSDGLSALPRRFSEHLVQLMSRMVKLRHFDTSQAIGGEAELVTQMSSYIAACIVAQIDESDNPESIQKRKELLVEEARRGLECFRDRFWRCEAKDSTGQRRCKNYWEGHDKGHQFDDTMNFSPDGSNENIEVGLGGIRGIIEVTILDEIERAVGQGLRIQELFDLVIGTSTGGLVALGVFENNWSLNEADRYFNSLLKEAFSARRLIAVPVLSKVAEPFMTHKYKTAGINNTLQANFGKNFLFGQTELLQSTGDRVKVGVVTCLEGQNQPCLIANYSRNPSDKLKDGREGYDCLQREDEQKKDFLTWQAARATSAAQTLYKPYIHPPTYRTYVDGATVRNNPVRLAYEEGMRIWKSSKPPDIILSLGTGILVDKDGKVTSKRNAHMESIKNVLPKGFKKKVETGLDMVQATLDCHREWVDFSGAFRGRLGHNCHRLDVGLTVKPPALDAIKEASSLRTACQKYLQSNPNKQDKAVPYFQPEYSNARSHIRSIARRLLASLFYLGHDLTRDMIRGTLESTLYCRLSPHSDGAPALISNTHGPVFRIREVNDRNEEVVRPIQLPQERRFDPKTMSTPVEIEISGGPYERFVEVQFRQWKHHWEPIGGF